MSRVTPKFPKYRAGSAPPWHPPLPSTRTIPGTNLWSSYTSLSFSNSKCKTKFTEMCFSMSVVLPFLQSNLRSGHGFVISFQVIWRHLLSAKFVSAWSHLGLYLLSAIIKTRKHTVSYFKDSLSRQNLKLKCYFQQEVSFNHAVTATGTYGAPTAPGFTWNTVTSALLYILGCSTRKIQNWVLHACLSNQP